MDNNIKSINPTKNDISYIETNFFSMIYLSITSFNDINISLNNLIKRYNKFSEISF